MNNVVFVESDVKKRINQILGLYGVKEPVLIDNEAEDMILHALSQNNIESVFIDHEGALIIEYRENNEQATI